MKKLLFFWLILFFGLANLGYSQSGDEIYREANPQYEEIKLSPQQDAWKRVIEARKTGDEQYYKQVLQEYRTNFPGSNSSDYTSIEAPHPDNIGQINPPFNQDWINGGDNIISAGGPPNPGIWERNLRLNIDSLGTQYCAYIADNRDTLVIWRSTDGGMHWTRLSGLLPGGTTKWHSFDMYITDSTGGPRLGIIGCRTSSVSTLDGQAYWVSYSTNGVFTGATLIDNPPAGRGYIEPSIVSDGRDWSPGLTYWYVAYRDVNSSTGDGDSAVTSNSVDWGQTWETPMGVRSFDDYDLDIDYNFRADSIYVLLTNAITSTNPNLRLMRTSLGNFGSGTWTQNNVASTSDPEDLGELAVARNDNEMAIVYTRQVGGTDVVYYDFWNGGGGGYWNNDAVVFNQAQPQIIAAIDCNISQWAWRMCFQVDAATDTIVYMSTTNLSSGFVGRTQVSDNPPTGVVGPDVAGYTDPTNGGAVTYVRFGGTPVYYDNSSITTNITNGTGIPEIYDLSQNFPNPFNPSTTIKYSIPQAGNVKLIVFDALGREVTTLVNGNIEAGSHSVDFDASGLSSGIYFYRLIAGDFNEIKKMMLIK